jgi:hypothetical protein
MKDLRKKESIVKFKKFPDLRSDVLRMKKIS